MRRPRAAFNSSGPKGPHRFTCSQAPLGNEKLTCFHRCNAVPISQANRARLGAQASRLHHAPQAHALVAKSRRPTVRHFRTQPKTAQPITGSHLRCVAVGTPALPAARTFFAVPHRDEMATTPLCSAPVRRPSSVPEVPAVSAIHQRLPSDLPKVCPIAPATQPQPTTLSTG